LAGAMTALNDIHVLMVDDNGPMRQLIRALARAGGIVHFSEAATAMEALDILRATPVDLVVVDWKMRPMDGLSFTRIIRWNSDSPNPYVPILMLTAHTEVSRVAAARDAGVTGFLKKPISRHVLRSRPQARPSRLVSRPVSSRRRYRRSRHVRSRRYPRQRLTVARACTARASVL